ncbi:Regulatory protein cys-3 [Ophiocordyceps camponoti-floridani]|uniref:Regulatory protein cys-3 n=1 Tax=Ophiocordyceps camponoti-floridani TaxID=2030778 RepID=A0A8H4Q3S1_9HYPO|nr:Regulatory protein cys-3 [Ophiocordyceps camponoti-floridani]
MSAYNGRHAPNVSQYLRDLNTINPQDTSAADEGFAIEDDLALFTNTQFFDFDSGQNMDFQAQPVKAAAESVAPSSSSPSDDVSPSVMGDMPTLDFISGDFSFSDFNNAYTAAPLDAFAGSSPGFTPLQPDQTPTQPQQPAQFRKGGERESDKRKSDAMSNGVQSLNLEDGSRQAAEEDKRRRNTAASARFRIKKKQREQALEKSAKEMTEKISTLESKVVQLETENKWLKNLLVEKNEGNEDTATLWKEFTRYASEKSKAKTSHAGLKKER